MEWLIWIGAALAALGLCGIVASLLRVARVRRQKLSDAELRDRVRRAMPLNMGAFFLSMFGLMLAVVGVILA